MKRLKPKANARYSFEPNQHHRILLGHIAMGTLVCGLFSWFLDTGFQAHAQGFVPVDDRQSFPDANASPRRDSESVRRFDQKDSRAANAPGTPPKDAPTPKADFSKAQPEDITDENFPGEVDAVQMTFNNADVTEIVKAISKFTGKNFIVDPSVKGKITIIANSAVTEAEAYKAFLSALAINGFTVVPSGQFLKIRPSRDARKDPIETYAGAYFPDADLMITRIIKLKYIDAAEAIKTLRQVVSKDGDIQSYDPTNTLIISDYGSMVERITRIVDQLDVQGFEEQMAVIRINFAKATDIAQMIDQIINKGSGGSARFSSARFRRPTPTESGGRTDALSSVIPDERTNSIIVVGNQSGIDRIRDLVKKLDTQLTLDDTGGVYVYYVKHGEAEKIADVLNGIADEAEKKKKEAEKESQGPRVGRNAPPSLNVIEDIQESGGQAVFGGQVQVSADKDTNSLIITANRQDYEVVKNLLAKIDIQKDQVFVQAHIVDINASDVRNIGVNYYKFTDGGTDSNNNPVGGGRIGFRGGGGGIQELIDPSNDSGAILGFGGGSVVNVRVGATTVPVPNIVSLIRLLQRTTNSSVLSTPQIMAIDNEEATIEVGEEVPVGTQQNNTAAGVQTGIERRDATTKLVITPFISPDTDKVRLKIKQTVSDVSSRPPQAAELAAVSVALTKRAIETTIVMNSGDTAVLGGLMTDRESDQETKIPLLGDIPILGWLFKSSERNKGKSNITVFISPKIVRSERDNQNILEDKLNHRIDFIQKYMKGRDPHGEYFERLPRRAAADDTETPAPEAPATEGF